MGSLDRAPPPFIPKWIIHNFEIQCVFLDFMRGRKTISAEVRWTLYGLVELSTRALQNPKDPYWTIAMERYREDMKEIFWEYCEIETKFNLFKNQYKFMPWAQEEFARFGLVYRPRNLFEGNYPFA